MSSDLLSPRALMRGLWCPMGPIFTKGAGHPEEIEETSSLNQCQTVRGQAYIDITPNIRRTSTNKRFDVTLDHVESKGLY